LEIDTKKVVDKNAQGMQKRRKAVAVDDPRKQFCVVGKSIVVAVAMGAERRRGSRWSIGF
jgi:hypothetical protein